MCCVICSNHAWITILEIYLLHLCCLDVCFVMFLCYCILCIVIYCDLEINVKGKLDVVLQLLKKVNLVLDRIKLGDSYKQTDRQTDMQAGRKAGRLPDTSTHIQTVASSLFYQFILYILFRGGTVRFERTHTHTHTHTDTITHTRIHTHTHTHWARERDCEYSQNKVIFYLDV